MPLKINVGTNETARSILNEMLRPDNNNAPNNVAEQPVQQAAAQAERPADGLLMRTLRQIRREEGPSHAAYLKDVVVEKNVNLELDHSDEVDGGVSTRAMDNDWVEVDFASDLGRGPGGSRDDSHAVHAQQTMTELEHVSVDDVRTTYADFFAGLEGKDETQKKAELRKVLTAPGNGDPQGPITRAIKAQKDLQDSLVQAILQQDEPDRAMITALQRSALCTNALVELAIGILMAPDGAESYQGATVADALGQKMQPEGTQQRRETTEKVVRIFDEQLADLNRVYDSLSAKGHVVTADEFKLLETGLAKARKMLTDAQGGIRLKGGRNVVNLGSQDIDKDVLRQLETRIGEMSSRVEKLKVESLSEAAREIYNQFSFDLLKSPLFDRKYADQFLAKYCENMDEGTRQQTEKLINDFREGLENLKNAVDAGLKTGQMDKAKEAFRKLKRMFDDKNPYDIKHYIEGAQIDPDLLLNGHLPNISSSLQLWDSSRFDSLLSVVQEDQAMVFMDRLSDMVRIVKSEKVPIVSGALLEKVMDGSCGFSTAALAVAWGEQSIEAGIDDRHLVSSKRLGSGACNTVELCSYRKPDGSKEFRVFKPELPARVSMEENRKNTYDSTLKVSTLNASVSQMAKWLGFGNLVVDAHAGVHGGQFGLMMQQADGMTGQSISEAFKTGNTNKRIGQKTVGEVRQILEANGADAQKLLGNLRRALTDLDWFDHIVGQTDRNPGNYMIFIGDDLSVSLKGIDNDFSFSPDEEVDPDGRDCPPVISEDMYNQLGSLVAQMNEKSDAEIRQWLRVDAQLGMTGLTDAQLDKTAERMKRAWAYANSEKCTIIRNADEWGSKDSVQLQVQTAKKEDSNYFTRDVVGEDMFFCAGLPNGLIPAPKDDWDEGKKLKCRDQFFCMQNVMNTSDEDLLAKIPQPKKGEQPVSMAELRAFFTVLAKEPLRASRAIVPWPESGSNDDVLAAMVGVCRNAKNELVKELRTTGILPTGDELASHALIFFNGDFGEARSYPLKAKAFAKEFAVINRHPAIVNQEIKDLLKFGGGLDWVSFITECKKSLPSGVDETLVAEALMSELESGFKNPGYSPNEKEIGRLRRLIVNKLMVMPGEVPEMPDALGQEETSLFRKACAITPAGAGYYARVKEEYEKLVRDARKLED